MIQDMIMEDAPKSFVSRKALPAKNQKRHLKYLKKKKNKINNATDQHELPKYNQIGEYVENIDTINESTKSTLKSDYTPKGKKYITEFKDIPLAKATILSYKKDCKALSHVRYGDNIDGCILTDETTKVVGFISIEEKNNGQKWLQALEVTKPYRGYGLSKQLLREAVLHYGARYLSVNKNNEVAIHVYEQAGFERYAEIDDMILMKIDNVPRSIDEYTLLEAVSKDAKPIFIVNSFTNSTFGKVITAWTRSKYSHSALALDTSLEKLYTFSADPNGDPTINKFVGGFALENLQSYIKMAEDCIIDVKCFFVKEEDFFKIKQVLDHIVQVKDQTTYNVLNIFNIIFNRAAKTGKDDMSLVCSQFVAHVISMADIKLLDKPINLITPADLSMGISNNPKIYTLYDGLGKEYKKSKIDRIFRKLKQKAVLIKECSL